jgi:hypothetical protein
VRKPLVYGRTKNMLPYLGTGQPRNAGDSTAGGGSCGMGRLGGRDTLCRLPLSAGTTVVTCWSQGGTGWVTW